ncbi:transposase [Gemmatimonas sp.]|uniref:transposase n=1 Tax=Gemmatimonas sp. TaxID=1962908 RepID=UPI00398381AA
MPADARHHAGAEPRVLPRTRRHRRAHAHGAQASADRHTGGTPGVRARFATVEPVFGNLRAIKQLDRFTLRGRAKVNGQWTLYGLVHNIEKLAHAGYAA